MAKIVRLTENDLTRIVKRVIMESQSTHYHLYVEGLDEIEDTMKIKRLTDDDLDDIREQLEDEKKRIKGEKYLTEIEKKRLNKRVNSLIEKLRSKIQEQRIASFDDEMGWYDEYDRPVKPEDFGDDYDEEEFDEFEPMMAKHGKNQRWFDDSTQDRYSHPTGKKMFDKYREHTGKPFKVRTRRNRD